jgi:hypothetical protein
MADEGEARRQRRRRRAPDPAYYRGSRRAWSPATFASASEVDRDLEREIDAIATLLGERGPMSPTELRRQLESRFWGPGRFRRALAIAERRGRVARLGRRLYGPSG